MNSLARVSSSSSSAVQSNPVNDEKQKGESISSQKKSLKGWMEKTSPFFVIARSEFRRLSSLSLPIPGLINTKITSPALNCLFFQSRHFSPFKLLIIKNAAPTQLQNIKRLSIYALLQVVHLFASGVAKPRRRTLTEPTKAKAKQVSPRVCSSFRQDEERTFNNTSYE